MRDLIKYEIQKQRNYKFIQIVGIAILIFYIVMGMLGKMSLYAPWDPDYFLAHEEYRRAQKDMKHGVVDEIYAANWEKAYKEYVDEHRLSDKEIKKRLKREKVEASVSDILYDWDYGNCVMSVEDFNTDEKDVLDSEYALIQYSKDPLSIITNTETYAPGLAEDYLQCAKEHMEHMDIVAGYHHGWDVMVSINSQLPYTLGILLVVCFFSLFGTEWETGMKSLIQVSRYGRRKVVTAKLLYAVGITTLLCLVFQMTALIGTSIIYGLEGADCTVYEELYPCPYGFTYLQYYLLQSVIGYLGTLTFMLFVCVLSCLFRRRLSLMVGLGVILGAGAPITLFESVEPAFQTFDKIKVLMPTQIMGAFNTFQIYQGYEVGNHVIRLPQMTLIAIIAWITLFLIIIYRKEASYMFKK